MKKYLLLSALLALLVLGMFHPRSHNATAPSSVTTKVPIVSTSAAPIVTRKEAHAPASSASTSGTASNEIPEISIPIRAADAVLRIGTTTYPLYISGAETVYDAMRALKDSGQLSFTSREYAGMGGMILSINGIASTGDMVWIFYVNDKKSQMGVSSVKVASGDSIEWKYEKSY